MTSDNDSDRRRAMDKFLKEFKGKYGDGSIIRSDEVVVNPPIPSGSFSLDFATGIGGLPSDRVIEVAGDEGCGKTTLGILSIKQFLDKDPRIAMIIDTEHKLTTSWIEQLIGAEYMHRIHVVKPLYMEQATNMYVDALTTGLVGFVLFDSIGGTPNQAGFEKDAEKVQVGGNAGSVSKFARLAAAYSAKFQCLTFCVNQVRADLSGYHRHMTPGGHAFKHACILRIKLKKTPDKVLSEIDGEKIVVGYKIHASVIKNQLAAPGRSAWWWFYNIETPEYGFGIDKSDEIVRLAIITGVIDQRGAWYYYRGLPEYKESGDRKVNGLSSLKDMIAVDQSLSESIVSETMAMLNSDASLVAEAVPYDPTAIEEDV